MHVTKFSTRVRFYFRDKWSERSIAASTGPISYIPPPPLRPFPLLPSALTNSWGSQDFVFWSLPGPGAGGGGARARASTTTTNQRRGGQPATLVR